MAKKFVISGHNYLKLPCAMKSNKFLEFKGTCSV